MDKGVSIVGAGLSGCEAALVLARNGVPVTLYDQKPATSAAAYVLPSFAELVCNNIFAHRNLNTPLGLLLSELTMLNSPLIKLAGYSQLSDDSFLSVDKKRFSQLVTEALISANVTVVCKQMLDLPNEGTVILATGPLTCDSFLCNISQKIRAHSFHFSDASSIVVDIKSVDTNYSHFTRLSDDLYIVQLSRYEFHKFYEHLLHGHTVSAHIEEDLSVFKECQSIERIANDGEDELLSRKFNDPNRTGICFYLRRENGLEDGFILSGFMTTLRHADQERIIRSLPGFTNARIIKYGRAHRNTYFDAPSILDEFYKVYNHDVYIIGQLSGVDGYIPCISSGYVAAQRIIHGAHLEPFPEDTIIGALAHYVSNKSVTEYSPMGPSFSLINHDLLTSNDYYTQSMNSLKQYSAKYLYN